MGENAEEAAFASSGLGTSVKTCHCRQMHVLYPQTVIHGFPYAIMAVDAVTSTRRYINKVGLCEGEVRSRDG